MPVFRAKMSGVGSFTVGAPRLSVMGGKASHPHPPPPPRGAEWRILFLSYETGKLINNE